jgi:hypothetical protein
VIVDFVFENGLLYIAVENIGDSPAYNVSVSFDHQLQGAEGSKPINEMALFNDLAFLPSGKKIVAFLESATSYFRRGQPTEVTVRVVFHDRWGRRRVNRIRHNLEVYRDLRYVEH